MIEARAHAFGDIGVQIRARILSVLTTVESERIENAGEKRVRREVVSEIREELRQTAEFNCDGLAAVVDSRVDAGTVHAIAVMSRAEAANSFNARAERARREIRAIKVSFAAAIAAREPREAVRFVRELGAPTFKLAQALTLEEAVLGRPLGTTVWSDVFARAAARTELREINSTFAVEICATVADDFPEGAEFAAAVADLVAARGPEVTRCGQSTTAGTTLGMDVRVQGTFYEEPLLAGVTFCRASATLSVFAGNTMMLSASLGGDASRAGGSDRETSAKYALAELSKLSATKLGDVFGE